MKISINDTANNSFDFDNDFDFDINDCIKCDVRNDCDIFLDVLDQIRVTQDNVNPDDDSDGDIDYATTQDDYEALLDMIEDWIADYVDSIGDDVFLDVFKDSQITADIPFDNCISITMKLADGFIINDFCVDWLCDDTSYGRRVDRVMKSIFYKAIDHILFVTSDC